MASSRVMSSSSPPPPSSSSDLARFKPGSGLGSMNMEDLLRNIYGDLPPPPAAGGDAPPSPSPVVEVGAARTVEEVWMEISGGGGVAGPPAACAGGAEMTLEDFLAREDDARVAGVERAAGVGVGDAGRGRKRALMDPIDRAAMQRQKRMIKNRESAARSRERKQAYIAELESMVMQLEKENARLLRELEEQNQKRLKELKEQEIPVIMRKKPSRALRRTNSMGW